MDKRFIIKTKNKGDNMKGTEALKQLQKVCDTIRLPKEVSDDNVLTHKLIDEWAKTIHSELEAWSGVDDDKWQEWLTWKSERGIE